MSLEDDRATPFIGEPKTERRSSKPQSETQRFAAVENYTIFMLKGIKSQVKNPRAAEILEPGVSELIYRVAEREIKRIKQTQEDRKVKK